ncbi:hypothetical protein SLEP1_g43134 [Rubroshorea leprosula]|uniref:Uncharacterized protein n=1 Tax=Rubroshorea leprosula TaxID=152421 RepID=A0AAV5LCS5_9ROSI|nr:hypothetical protein SLEP1_g43134 [Rubroshorea leprosula]
MGQVDMVQVDLDPEQSIQLEKNEEVGSCDKKKGQKGTVDSVGEQSQEAIIDFTPTQEELHWLEGGMVAILKSLMSISNIQERIDVDGGLIMVSPLGGRSVLLLERVKGYLGKYMEQNKELCDAWFESIQPWAVASPQRSRLVWVRISGIPLKAWCERCITLIGGTVGEVVMVHDDTKKKSFLCEGRVLVLCTDATKIAKLVQLKIEGQIHEVWVSEEEWRSDPDWWLSDGDRRSSSGASSEDSVSQIGEEDQEINIAEISAEEEDSIDSEQFQMEGNLNSNSREITAQEEYGMNGGIEQGMDDRGIVDSIGLVKDNELIADNGPGVNFTGMVENCKSLGPKVIVLEEATRDKDRKEVMGKRMRKLADCDPQEGRETREEQAIWVTRRLKQRQARRMKAQQQPEEASRSQQELRSDSLSDGCIAHRNRVIHQELNLQEVRRMIRAGRRLGMQFQGNEEEVGWKWVLLAMKFISFNVRGLGGTVKRRELGNLVRAEKPDFLFVQETKLQEIDEGLCQRLWYLDEFGWSMKSSIGASGGLLCVWNMSIFVKLEEFVGDGFLGIKGVWGVNKEPCLFVNVYGPTDRRRKAALWDELRQRITEEGGRWLLAGDFNAVRCLEERRGRTGMSVEMSEFDAFIETTGLVDLKLANRKFTWYRPDGTSMSRLDRVLMTVEMSSMGEEWVQKGLRRNISDHCAIILKTRVTDWGPRPFRVLDVWQQHLDFKKFVEDNWNEMEVDGFAGYRYLQKLKMLKKFLKGWNKEVFGDVEAQFQDAIDKVAQIDMKNEEADLEVEELAERKEGFHEMWDIMKKREIIWKQKSRCSWAKLGDANTRFFHKVANGRKAFNNINGFVCDGKWVEEPVEVKREVVRYFGKRFDGESWRRPKPVGINFKQISEEMKTGLERPFSEEEIEEGLKSCEGAKAPGPDGFNFNFLKFAWNCLKADFMSFFEEFHQNGRLKGVMSGIISDSQSAFLGGRQLVDSVLVLNEVVDEVKLKKQKSFVFKADFEKAYDCVDWAYLDWMLCRMGFGMKWRGWIRECLSTARISVLVNGSPTEEFGMGKGLRQGDPLSPFLFLIVAEGLNGLVRRAEAEGMLHGIAVGNKGLIVSLLQFANDTVILGNADSENIFAVKTILRCFELMSGLRINFCKSSVARFNVSERWIKGAASVLHCGVGGTSFWYLGLPVGGKIKCKKMWEPVLEKFRARLAIWKSSTLSSGGRITLLHSILSAIPIFYMSLFLMPKCVVSELISIQRAFLWGGVELKRQIPWVKWEYICLSKNKGGLGVLDLCRKNWALLGKWWFRLGDGVEGLWKKVVREKYYGGREEVDITTFENVRVSKIWRDIINIGQRSVRSQDLLSKGFKWVVGNGYRVGFWRSVWVGEKSLKELCPRLFELAINKEGFLSEIGGWEEGSWRWNIIWRRERFGREKDEELKLWEVLSSVCIKVGVADRWRWRHASDGMYVVKQAYEFLQPTDSILNDWLCKLIWCRLVPSKVSFFGWRLCLQRLPTKWNLHKKGVVLEGGLMCGLCNEEVEDTNHLFCTCKEVWLIWVKVMSWWGVEVVLPSSLEGVAEFFIYGLGEVVGKELGASIFLVTSWYIWYWRNCRVFKGDVAFREGLLDMLQEKIFFWVKNKVQGCVFSVCDWKVNPQECAAAMRNYKRRQKEFHQHQKGRL